MSDISSDQAIQILIVLGALLLLVLLIDVILFVAWALRKDRVDAGLAPPLFAPRWSLVDVWIAGQVFVGLLVTVGIGAMIVVALVGEVIGKPVFSSGSSGIPLGLILVLLLFQDALLVAIPLWFITRKYGATLRGIGLPPLPRRRDWLIGLSCGLLVLFVGLGIEMTLTWLIQQILPSSASKSLTEASRSVSIESMLPKAQSSFGLYLLLFLGGAIGAPVGEEVFFRGFLYNCAKRRLGLAGGTLLSAAIFALVHFGPLQVIAILPMGILLAVMYERTGSLWVPTIMHATNNGILLIVAYFFYTPG